MANNFEETSKTEFWMLDIADLPQFYNPVHQVIRVSFRGKYYDIKCDPGHHVPSQKDHKVVAMVREGFFDYAPYVSDERFGLPPGLEASGKPSPTQRGMCYLVNNNQTLVTTNPQSASSSFSISDVNMFDMSNVATALAPPIYGMDYTTLADPTKGDLNNLGVGIFINKQGTILIKSKGGSITLGKEGVHIGGKFASEASVKDTGVLSDNGLARLIPSSMPTAAIAIPKIPNIGSIASIANVGLKFMDIADKASQISADIGSLA